MQNDMRSCILHFAFCILILFSDAALAQSPAANWRTLTTPHFRIHYPAEYEAFAVRAASRMESIRDAVVVEVGFDPPQVIDVVVSNPAAQLNGIAWPFLDTPRIELYAEPPDSDEHLGGYSHWIDLVTVHEVAHVVHMLRPSRNPARRAMERFVLPVNPILLGAPRWVLEGYATVVEGRLTGAGRPTSTLRAVILRKWAENGRLPSYGRLNSDQRFLGMSMAYLAGSAFLEWLEARAGAGSLRKVWARMTARERRTFDSAFTGVFGDSPERLYGRFTAELTEAAVTIARSGAIVEGELWQETSRASGDPAVSPDGSELALVLRRQNQPPRLVILSTGPADDEEKQYKERIEKMLARDPEDVAPVRTRPLARKAKHTLELPDGADIEWPRWARDGKSIVYSRRVRDGRGVLHYDLFRWTPASGANERITRLADVRNADPHPDGRTAVAVRSRLGMTQLVRVDLESGEVTPMSEPSLDTIVAHPRVSAEGRVAHVVHRESAWRVLIDGQEIARDASWPEWGADGSLYATVSARGFAEITRLVPLVSRAPLTHSVGGAVQPAPSPDGRIFFMSLEPDGFVVRVLPANAPSAPEPAPFDRPLVPALPPPAPQAAPFAVAELSPARAYGIGRQELGWIVSQNYSSSERSTEFGARLGDVVGRLDTLVLGSIGDVDGGAIASMWRGWPVAAGAHLFHANDDTGLELRGSWTHRGMLHRITVDGGALLGDESLGFVDAFCVSGRRFGSWWVSESLRLAAENDHTRGVVRVGASGTNLSIALQYQRDEGDVVLGGLPSSILPRSAQAARVFDPALPLATLAADRYDGRRVEVSLAAFPMTAFYQQHRMEGDPIAVAGLEFAARSGPIPILKYPGLDLTLGVARVLDEPLRGETRWWIGVHWTP